MSSTGKSKKSDALRTKLFSNDESTLLSALQELSSTGTAVHIEPLIVLYSSTPFDSVKKQAGELLSTLKVSGAEEPFIAALSNPALLSIRKDLLGFLWSSGVQPVNSLVTISTIAIEGTFEEALECITVIDSLETPVAEEILLECITQVKQHLSQSKPSDKSALMIQYLQALENLRMAD